MSTKTFHLSQGDADYSDQGEMVWSNAESPAHYRDQCRDQQRETYSDQYRDPQIDLYRDHQRDPYRDPYRDQYRDPHRDQYRDPHRDPHRDQVPHGKPPTPLGSPYKVLPPIGLSDTEEVGLLFSGETTKSLTFPPLSIARYSFGFEPGLTLLRVQHSTNEIPRSTSNV